MVTDSSGKNSQLRLCAIGMAIGLLVTLGVTVLHPKVTAIQAWQKGITSVGFHHSLTLDHLVFAIAITLLIVAASAIECTLAQPSAVLARLGTVVWLLSLPLWLSVLSVELGFLPLLAQACRSEVSGSGPVASHLRAVMAGGWAVPLLGGYFATGLMWLGVTLWGWSHLRETEGQRRNASHTDFIETNRWFGMWAVMGRLLGCVGLPIGALIDKPWAAWVLGLTSIVPGAWLALATLRLWQVGTNTSSPQ